MTVAALTPSVEYFEDGVTLAFPAPFRFLPSTLLVERIFGNGDIAVLSPGSQYTTAGGDTDAGGTVSLLATVAGARLRILRDTPRRQQADYTTNDTFPAESHEQALDRQMLIAQELDVKVGDVGTRALMVPYGETIGEVPKDIDRPGKFLAFDAVGNPVPASGLGADDGLREDLAQDYGASLAGVKQPLLQAVKRTVYAKAIEALTPGDFGIIGDGSTDNTNAFARLAANMPERREFELVEGNYLTGGQATFNQENVKFNLKKARIIQTGANKKTWNFTKADISIQGGEFYGLGTEPITGSTSYNGVAGVFFENPRNVDLQGTVFRNHAGGDVRWTGSANGLRMSGLLCKGVGSAGGIDVGDNTSDFAIGSVASTSDNGVLVIDSDISDHCFGVGLSRGYGSAVLGGSIHDIPGQHGIYGSSQGGLIVSGVTFADIVYEAVKNQNAVGGPGYEDGVYTSNIFKRIGQSCFAFANVSGATGRRSNLMIADNIADEIGNYFATIAACDGGDLVNNRVRNCGAVPLNLSDWRGRVISNMIERAEWYGLYADINGYSEFIDNTFIDVALNSAGAASQLRYQVMAYLRNTAASGAGIDVLWRRNNFRMSSSPTHLARSLRTHPGLNLHYEGGHDWTGLGVLLETVSFYSPGYSPNALNVSSGMINPPAPIYGRGRRELYGTQSPSAAGMADSFIPGDICWNAAPEESKEVGWVCTAAGTPGTWSAFGTIAA